MINAFWEDLVFEVQEGKAAEWRLVIDTSHASLSNGCEDGRAEHLSSLTRRGIRSVVVLVKR